MQAAFANLVGRVQAAQQLMSPPRLLPAIPYDPLMRSLSQSPSTMGSSSCSMKSRYFAPFPPVFSLGSYEQVYSLIRSAVFQMPTTMISLIFPSSASWLSVFCTNQAVPKAAWLLLKRFWPSCISKTQYFLRGLSQKEGGQQMLHFLELPRILEETLLLSTILLAVGWKLGQISMVLSPPVRMELLPNIQAESFSSNLTLMVTFSGQRSAAFHQFVPVLLSTIPLVHVRLQLSPLMQIFCPPRLASGQYPTKVVKTALGAIWKAIPAASRSIQRYDFIIKQI